jgi:hypothetical protein
VTTGCSYVKGAMTAGERVTEGIRCQGRSGEARSFKANIAGVVNSKRSDQWLFAVNNIARSAGWRYVGQVKLLGVTRRMVGIFVLACTQLTGPS